MLRENNGNILRRVLKKTALPSVLFHNQIKEIVHYESVERYQKSPKSSSAKKAAEIKFKLSESEVDQILYPNSKARTEAISHGNHDGNTDVMKLLMTLWTTANQKDRMIPDLKIEINETRIGSPSNSVGGYSAPMDVTKLIMKNYKNPTNLIRIEWLDQTIAHETVGLDLGLYRVISAEELRRRLLSKKREKLKTFEDIKKRLEQRTSQEQPESTDSNGDQLQGTCSRRSECLPLNCKLTNERMQLPCRGQDCQHLESFDAFQFLKEVKNKAILNSRCPVCYQQIKEDKLLLDRDLLNVLTENPPLPHVTHILVDAQGTWYPKPQTK